MASNPSYRVTDICVNIIILTQLLITVDRHDAKLIRLNRGELLTRVTTPATANTVYLIIRS